MEKRICVWIGTLLAALVLCCGLCSAAEDTLVTERQIFEYLTGELELPTAAACGVLANIEQESGFNAGALGDNGTSYGLCQWHDSRYLTLRSYCLGSGLDHRTVSGQLEYLAYELENNYPALLAALRSLANTQQSAYLAGYIWCVEFERPADQESKAVLRGNLAKGKYWSRYSTMDFAQQVEEMAPIEDVIAVARQSEVTIPQPPEEEETVVYRSKGLPDLVLPGYGSWSAAPQEQKLDLAAALAPSILFMPLSDGKRERFVLPEPEFAEIFA